jgi:hypothetical protein
VEFFIPVAGTWGTDAEPPERVWWYQSPFLSFMLENGFGVYDPADPFYWSTDYSRAAWIAGGHALNWYVQTKAGVASHGVKLITHSFGINVAAFAAYHGLEIDTLIAVGPPWRADMVEPFKYLRARTRKFMTIHAAEWDRMAVGGGIGDGVISPYPPVFDADLRDTVPGISHSKVLYSPEWFHWWKDAAWLNLLASKDWSYQNPARQASRSTLPPRTFSNKLSPTSTPRRRTLRPVLGRSLV